MSTTSATWPGGSTAKSGPTRIMVGARDPQFSGRGTYVDGLSPVVQDTHLSFEDAAAMLCITLPDGQLLRWPFADLRMLRDQAGAEGMLLGLSNGDPARIEVDDADAELIRTRAPHLNRRIRIVRRGRLLGLGLMAMAAVALMIFVFVPLLADRLATYLPPEGEAALGDATFEQIRFALDETGLGVGLGVCETEDGIAALDEMTARLLDVATDLETPVRVAVLDHPMINAFALPGGRVVLFKGLIDAAEKPEEVAAVLAHEIGHVAARDPTRIALRSAGSIGVLGLLFGDFAGGTLVLFLAERIIQADYTQEAEAAADAYAAALMVDAGLPPSALATFFERLQEEFGNTPAIVRHFLAHPELDDRIAAARAIDAPFDGRVLSPDGWAALQSICEE